MDQIRVLVSGLFNSFSSDRSCFIRSPIDGVLVRTYLLTM